MITDYSRDEIKKLVDDGICPVQAIRDWEIVKSRIEGKKIDDIAFDARLCRAQVHNIIKKYRNGKPV
jgi:Mor family transcriptional regulator